MFPGKHIQGTNEEIEGLCPPGALWYQPCSCTHEVGPTESLILLQSFIILSQSASPTPPVADTAKGKERGGREGERERDKTWGKVGRTAKEEATLSNETWEHYSPTSES